jgi:hypothetical protein
MGQYRISPFAIASLIASGQVEYALSPSVAVYVGGATDRTNFKTAPNNGVLQSSTGTNVLAGISFDISGVIRGLVGAGYSGRQYSQFKQYNPMACPFRPASIFSS